MMMSMRSLNYDDWNDYELCLRIKILFSIILEFPARDKDFQILDVLVLPEHFEWVSGTIRFVLPEHFK
jgi:hypothetical protein